MSRFRLKYHCSGCFIFISALLSKRLEKCTIQTCHGHPPIALWLQEVSTRNISLAIVVYSREFLSRSICLFGPLQWFLNLMNNPIIILFLNLRLKSQSCSRWHLLTSWMFSLLLASIMLDHRELSDREQSIATARILLVHSALFWLASGGIGTYSGWALYNRPSVSLSCYRWLPKLSCYLLSQSINVVFSFRVCTGRVLSSPVWVYFIYRR